MLARRNLQVTLVISSVALNLLMVLGLVVWLGPEGGWRKVHEKLSGLRSPEATTDLDKATYLAREGILEGLLPIPHANVFLGDSHVGGYEWHEVFPNALNRGIGGETTVGLLKRLPGIVHMHARAIFLVIGHNDFGNLGLSAQQSIANLREIVAEIRRDSPETVIYLQSLILCRKSWKNPPRLTINAALKLMADGDKVRYIGFSDALLKDGLLDSRYTLDGEHLNSDGYEIWTRALLTNAPELRRAP